MSVDTELLSGEGELFKCPKCGNTDSFSYEDEDNYGGGLLYKRLYCQKCDSKFVETWKIVGWEEDRPIPF